MKLLSKLYITSTVKYLLFLNISVAVPKCGKDFSPSGNMYFLRSDGYLPLAVKTVKI